MVSAGGPKTGKRRKLPAVPDPPPLLLSPPPKWVIVQLTPTGEREKNLNLIVRAVRQLLGQKDIEVFVPAISQKVRDESHTLFYMDGYVFVKHVESVSYLKLQETTYFQSVLCQPSFINGVRKRAYSLLDDSHLEPMRRGMQELKVGEFAKDQEVRIVKGTYKNLIGRVNYVHDDNEHIQVYVGLRSKQILMDFPSSYLTKVVQV